VRPKRKRRKGGIGEQVERRANGNDGFGDTKRDKTGPNCETRRPMDRRHPVDAGHRPTTTPATEIRPANSYAAASSRSRTSSKGARHPIDVRAPARQSGPQGRRTSAPAPKTADEAENTLRQRRQHLHFEPRQEGVKSVAEVLKATPSENATPPTHTVSDRSGC